MRNIFLKLAVILGVRVLLTLPFLAIAKGSEKITICHATGSETNPFVKITISINGLYGHINHEGDIIPAPPEGCDVEPPFPASE